LKLQGTIVGEGRLQIAVVLEQTFPTVGGGGRRSTARVQSTLEMPSGHSLCLLLSPDDAKTERDRVAIVTAELDPSRSNYR